MASSKTLFRFLCVRAEHSRYLWALISFAQDRAWSYDTGSILFWRSESIVAPSSRRSSLVPTRMMGMFGAWWSISGNHWRKEVNKCAASHPIVFWAPYLGLDIVKRRRADDGEADEEDVGLGVRERAQPVVVLLASRIPQAQTDGLAIHHDTS